MRRVALFLAVAALAGCGGDDDEGGERPRPDVPDRIRLTSPAFPGGGEMPRRFTCDGKEVSPPLRWSGVPTRPIELLLLMEDPDAPRGTFVHWVVTRIPPGTRGVGEGQVPDGAAELEQSFGKRSYGGPCPPEDDPPHDYVFTLYSLNQRLPIGDSASPEEVRAALKGIVSARGSLRVRYGR